MENSITLDLKTYTDLIRENQHLKECIARLKNTFENELDDYYVNHSVPLYCIKDKARLKGIAEEKDDVKALDSAGLYVSEIKKVVVKYKMVYSIEYACAYLANAVRAEAESTLKKM